MTTEVERQLTEHASRLQRFEVEMQKLALELEHQEERAAARHEALSTSQLEMKDMLQARAKMDEERAREAREYRARREALEAEERAAHKAWIRSLVNPQTLVILGAILASMLGLQAAEFGRLVDAPAVELPE